jgi:hypothetical protein
MAITALSMLLLLVPRKYAFISMVLAACFVSPAQRIVVMSLDFHVLRLLVVVGWLRIIVHNEYFGYRFRALDAAITAWGLAGALAMTVTHGTLDVVINRMGMLFDVIGMYFMFRVFVRDRKDVELIIRSLALLSIPVMVIFLIEHMTSRNMFAVLGGVPEVTTIRAGRLRCQGPFLHPILAGCFWAALIPMLAWLVWGQRRYRWLAIVGTVAACIVVVTCASSTPISSLFFGGCVACLYPLRRQMKAVRWLGVLVLVMLQLVMRGPLWSLMARVDIFAGSTGWYRYKLLDEFFKHIGDWWLIGTNSMQNWWQRGEWAITNQYVAEGINGGMVTLGLFILVIWLGFRNIGRFARQNGGIAARATLAWALGISLFIHAISFFGVCYFGQNTMIWLFTLAMTASLAPSVSPAGRLALWRVRRLGPPTASNERELPVEEARPASTGQSVIVHEGGTLP